MKEITSVIYTIYFVLEITSVWTNSGLMLVMMTKWEKEIFRNEH